MKLIFASNLNIMTDLVHPDDRESIITTSYIPLLRAHDLASIPTTIFASGWSLEYMHKRDSQSLRYLAELKDRFIDLSINYP